MFTIHLSGAGTKVYIFVRNALVEEDCIFNNVVLSTKLSAFRNNLFKNVLFKDHTRKSIQIGQVTARGDK